jgi:hypothetical protein
LNENYINVSNHNNNKGDNNTNTSNKIETSKNKPINSTSDSDDDNNSKFSVRIEHNNNTNTILQNKRQPKITEQLRNSGLNIKLEGNRSIQSTNNNNNVTNSTMLLPDSTKNVNGDINMIKTNYYKSYKESKLEDLPVLDSGASNTTTFRRNLFNEFQTIKKSDGHKVLMGGNKNMSYNIEGIGKIGKLKNAFYVPDLKRELISIPQLMDEFTTIFTGNRCTIYETASPHTLLMSGTLSNVSNLVHMNYQKQGPPTYTDFLLLVLLTQKVTI